VAPVRVYVSSDIEGVAGVVAGDQTAPTGGVEYARARRLMTAEVNAAVGAAFDAGASEVLVNDGHGPNTNLLVEELDERVRLLMGKPKALNMAATLTPSAARTAIADAVGRALRGDPSVGLLRPPAPPFELEIVFLRSGMADVAAIMPGAERADGRTVRWRGDAYVEAFQACRALLLLGSTAT
jgi:D-aminopeptidase